MCTLLVNFWFVILHGPHAGLISLFFECIVLKLPETKPRCSSQDSSQDWFLQAVVMRQFPTRLPPACAPPGITQLPCIPTQHIRPCSRKNKPCLCGMSSFFAEPPVSTIPHLMLCRSISGGQRGNYVRSLPAQGRLGLGKAVGFSSSSLSLH